MALTQDPEQVFIKIYAKNTNSYNDDLVGLGSEVVESSGEIVVGVQNAKELGERLGQLYVRLFLIDK